ncbi:MAG TPA: sigma-70 family RNA polymerase sigma factor [Chloroflexota bacterium]|nr:sigma-70 family RNA polymerase sigma factor [Chloroflexota bacterium]
MVASQDDAAVVAALRRGDEATFVRLIDRHQDSLLRLARLYVKDAAAAEDVVQETWLGLLTGLNRFEGRSSLRTWLFRILLNRARTRATRAARLVPFSILQGWEARRPDAVVDLKRFRGDDDPRYPGHWLLPPSPEDLPEERLLADELHAQVRAALDTLPPAQREVVLLRDVEGWPSYEVCQALRLSEANQRVLLHRGRSKVRAALETYLARKRQAV